MSLGASARKPPTSETERTRIYSNEKIKTLTKLKIQEYISSFFNRIECNSNLLKAIAPRYIHYNIDKSFDQTTDPTQRKLQIARYFNELKSILPSILIVDGGIEPVAHNIGSIGAAVAEMGIWKGSFPVLRNIPINIIVGAKEVEEADEISSLLSLFFNELRNLAGGSRITGKVENGENWTITLPNAPVSVSALTDVDVPDDPIERIWYAEATIDVLYEDVVAIQQQMPTLDSVIGFPDTNLNLKPIIDVPETLSINSQLQVIVKNMQDNFKIILSDGRKASITPSGLLTPRAYGQVGIRVVDTRKSQGFVVEKIINIV